MLKSIEVIIVVIIIVVGIKEKTIVFSKNIGRADGGLGKPAFSCLVRLDTQEKRLLFAVHIITQKTAPQVSLRSSAHSVEVLKFRTPFI